MSSRTLFMELNFIRKCLLPDIRVQENISCELEHAHTCHKCHCSNQRIHLYIRTEPWILSQWISYFKGKEKESALVNSSYCSIKYKGLLNMSRLDLVYMIWKPWNMFSGLELRANIILWLNNSVVKLSEVCLETYILVRRTSCRDVPSYFDYCTVDFFHFSLQILSSYIRFLFGREGTK